MTPTSSIRAAFTPTGRLRAAINLGNPILAHPADGGGAGGVSVDLAREFARLLEVELDLVVVDAAGKSVDVVAAGRADIGFFAIDPVRGADIAFSGPYVLIEGCYLVHEDSPIRSNDQVDHPQHRVVVGKGSAYDLFLTRSLQQASIERVVNAPAVLAALQAGQVEVAAGIRKLLEGWTSEHDGLRLLPGRFMVIQQAMGLPADRGDAAAAALGAFVEEMKASGFVAASLQRHGIVGGTVAPASA